MIKKMVYLAIVLLILSSLLACVTVIQPAPEPAPPTPEEWEDFFHGDYYETPEDCLPGEVYDPVEQLCFCEEIIEDDWYSDDFYDLVDDFADDFFSGEQDFEEIGGLGEEPFIIYEVQENNLTNPQKSTVDDALLPYQSDTAKHLEIFDSTFVSQNVYHGERVEKDQRKNLYQI